MATSLLHHSDGLAALDRRLHALCRERGPLRAVLARIAWRVVVVRAWERALVVSDPLGRFVADWVAWAERVTVRRLRDDVEWALALEETDPVAFAQSGGLPGQPGNRCAA